MTKPRYIHPHCDDCTFLGTYKDRDLYHCKQSSAGMSTLIARYADHGPGYTSMQVRLFEELPLSDKSGLYIDMFRAAYALAQEKGLILKKKNGSSGRKRKIKTFLPVYADALFEIDRPENWDEMNHQEKCDYFLDHLKTTASVCVDCSEKVNSDFELDMDWVNKTGSKEIAEMLSEWE